MPVTWDPAQYLNHAEHRLRPFRELADRVPFTPTRVVDLGCGPGNTTATLRERWPDARITGIDNSPEMLRTAREQTGHLPGLDYREGDILAYDPAADAPDLILSNAALQWVPDHTARFPRWIDALPSGGALAFQVPDTQDQPTHRILTELRTSARWRDHLADTTRTRVPAPTEYVAALTDLGCRVDVWETTYHQILTGPDPVLDWMLGTGLRPVLDALAPLGPDTRDAFLAEYRERLAAAYPAHPWGTDLPYHRTFAVAVKP